MCTKEAETCQHGQEKCLLKMDQAAFEAYARAVMIGEAVPTPCFLLILQDLGDDRLDDKIRLKKSRVVGVK